MYRLSLFLIISCTIIALAGCGGQNTSIPPDIEERFVALVDSLSLDTPGASVATLEEFLGRYNGWERADTVRVEIERFRSEADGRYHEARELARQGRFDESERILVDLADHLEDTPDGENAGRFLEFEFYFGKAKWLMVHQKFDECGAVARDLLEHDLTPYQADQVEMILDNVGYADTAVSMSERANAQNACRQLSVMLTQSFLEEGRYPERLSLSDIETWEPYSSDSILRGLSAIEDYETSGHAFSFVGVSSNGRHRVKVVDGRIEN